MGLFDSISKKMEESAKKRAKNKEIKQEEDAKYKEILNTTKIESSPLTIRFLRTNILSRD